MISPTVTCTLKWFKREQKKESRKEINKKKWKQGRKTRKGVED